MRSGCHLIVDLVNCISNQKTSVLTHTNEPRELNLLTFLYDLFDHLLCPYFDIQTITDIDDGPIR